MAVGYSRRATVQALLDFGADPEVADKKGRNVVKLVEDLRQAMPLSAETMGRRTMLEDVAAVLTGRGNLLTGASSIQAWSTMQTSCLRREYIAPWMLPHMSCIGWCCCPLL